MSKVISWVLTFTKLGKVATPIQAFLSGKKSYLAGLALLIPALVTMINNFSDNGMTYLLGVTATPEWAIFLNGLAVMGIRAAITKAADPAKDPNLNPQK